MIMIEENESVGIRDSLSAFVLRFTYVVWLLLRACISPTDSRNSPPVSVNEERKKKIDPQIYIFFSVSGDQQSVRRQ